MPNLSETAKSLLTLLNNIDELIVKSNNREDAIDVMKAFRVYAKNKHFNIPQDKINNFLQVIYDAKPYTLNYIIKDIASDIVQLDKKY